MSKGTKMGIAVIVIIIIIIWIWRSNSSTAPAPVVTQTPVEQTAPVVQPTVESVNGLSAINDNSDTGIDQNMAVIDTQLSALEDDSTSIDSSLNAK